MRNYNGYSYDPMMMLRRGGLSSHARQFGYRYYDKGLKYVMQKLQFHFGRAFILDKRNCSDEVKSQVLKRFIKKYDKNFDDHTTNHNDFIKMKEDVMLLLPLDKNDKKSGTFMYIASGSAIGSSELRWLSNNPIDMDDVYIYIFGKKMLRFAHEIERIIEEESNRKAFGIFTIDKSSGSRKGEESLDILYMDMEPRSLSTLFFSNKEKEMICDHLDKFVNSSSFYKERQLLYKTGILLYGEPGTGKTSLIKAIGTTYGRSLVQIQVNNISDINLNSLVQSINADDVRQYIVVLEDIDTLFLNREMGDVTEDKTINKLLQFLDSNTSPNNVIFIATTNHLERLDKALLREGRFDLKVNIAPLLKKDAIKFINSFEIYGEDAEDILRELEKLGKFTKDDQGRMRYNQSSLQAMTLSKRNNKSLDDTIAMYGEMEDSSVQAEPEKDKKDEKELVDVPDDDDEDDD